MLVKKTVSITDNKTLRLVKTCLKSAMKQKNMKKYDC